MTTVARFDCPVDLVQQRVYAQRNANFHACAAKAWEPAWWRLFPFYITSAKRSHFHTVAAKLYTECANRDWPHETLSDTVSDEMRHSTYCVARIYL
ncbi:MAG: hypothetical protein ACTSX8_05260 [Alphaproteobacteria bacterium]